MWLFRKKNKIKVNGETILVNKQHSILSSCLSNNIDIKHNCGAGKCGKCGKCRYILISGDVKNVRDTGNQMLACSTFPEGDIEIQTY